MPNTITQIGNRAFYNCSSLTSVCLSNNLETISEECFSYTGLASVVIPEGVKTLSSSVFSYCTSLQSVVLPNTLTNIGGSCFYWCRSLTNIVIPSSVNTINQWAFAYCNKLTGVILNNGLKKIEDSVFRYCDSLESITIPSTVYYISYYCFDKCPSFSSCVFEQIEGWYINNNENVYKEILSVPELAAKQLANSNSCWTCNLVARELISDSSLILSIGETRTISSRLNPETAIDAITYESLDESIATVDENGLVTAVSNGNTTILVKASGLTSYVNVFVGESKCTIDINNCPDLSYSNTPYTFTVNNFTWSNFGRIYCSNWDGVPCLFLNTQP